MNKYKCTIAIRGYPCDTVEIEACTRQRAKILADDWAIKKHGPGIKIMAINVDKFEVES